MNAATLAGMYGSRLPFPGALGYQSCITSERGFRPFVPGSCREGSTSSNERVPTGYAPVRAGMTSTGSPARGDAAAVVVLAADAVVDPTITLITTPPTATEARTGPAAAARDLRCLGRGPVTARDEQGGCGADGDERGAEVERWGDAVDEAGGGLVAAVVGEDCGEHCDAEDAAEFADGVVGA